MFCIKGINGLSKIEFGKIIHLIRKYNDLVDECDQYNLLNTSNIQDFISLHSEVYDDLQNNDYIIYEGIDKQIVSFIGIKSDSDETVINHIYITGQDPEKSAQKLVSMIKVISKHSIKAIVNDFDDNMIGLLQNVLDFQYVEIEDDDRIWMIQR